MEQIRRRRQSAGEWRGMLARYAGSGLTVAAFCQRESISTASFYRWRSVQSGAPPQSRPRQPRGAANTAKFVDLGSLDSHRPRVELRLDLGGGVLLHLVRG